MGDSDSSGTSSHIFFQLSLHCISFVDHLLASIILFFRWKIVVTLKQFLYLGSYFFFVRPFNSYFYFVLLYKTKRKQPHYAVQINAETMRFSTDPARIISYLLNYYSRRANMNAGLVLYNSGFFYHDGIVMERFYYLKSDNKVLFVDGYSKI